MLHYKLFENRLHLRKRIVSIGIIIFIISLFNIPINAQNNYFPNVSVKKPFVQASSSSILSLEIVGNTELDLYCSGNETDGLSPETAHIIEDLDINGEYKDSASRFRLISITRYLIIKNARITGAKSTSLVSGAGIFLDECQNIQFDNCSVFDNGIFGMRIIDSQNITVGNCYLDNNTIAGALIENSSEINITNSTSQRSSSAGFSIQDSSSLIEIKNCSIKENEQNGISILSSILINISECDISLNGLDGIYIKESEDISILGNSVEFNEYYGINVGTSSGIVIENNLLIQNKKGCFNFPNGETGITLTNNECKEVSKIPGYNYLILFIWVSIMYLIFFITRKKYIS